MSSDQIGIMHWNACKTCIHYDNRFVACTYDTIYNEQPIKMIHIGTDEVTCKSYEGEAQ